MNTAKIIDCTLRDGLYVVDHQMPIKHFDILFQQFEKFGLDYVEVGHGLGVGGSRFGVATPFVEKDLYALADSTFLNTKWGTFCILEKLKQIDLDLIRSNKPNFLKIGILPDCDDKINYDMLSSIIDLQINEVYLFLMQTNKWSPTNLRNAVNICKKFQFDGIYYVDSTGSAFPSDISNFHAIVKDIDDDLKIGFHGHDNLGLAVSNTVYAQELGYNLVDTTCLGIGRSAGNCSTEQFLAIQKLTNKIDTKIDIGKILNFSHNVIEHYLKPNSRNAVDILCGFRGIHTFNINDRKDKEIINNLIEMYK